MTTIQDKLLPTLQFLVLDWLRAGELTSRPRYADHDADTFTLVLESAAEIAGDVFEKASRVSDDEEPRIIDGRVALPDATYAAWRAYVDAGFLSMAQDAERGGQQLPRLVELASKVPVISAAGSLLPAMLTEAAAGLLLAHGSDAQKDVFATHMLAGRWAGTMCLSEPQAGSSLADITTKARPDGDGYAEDPLGPRYRIAGQKMWISGGEHELTDNIIHLVLAKTVGPDGDVDPTTKGISLFVVPRVLVSQDATPGEANDVTLVGLNHKLGSRGLPNTALAFGAGDHRPRGGSGAIGYLVGEPGDGLRQMFHMMNAARIRIGLLSAATGFAGYAESLAYAHERKQGRPRSTGAKGQWSPQVPIIEHADVRRMLLAQKSYCEGALALGLYAARLLDEEQTGEPADAQEAAHLLSILTPIVKSWPSEWCLESNSLAIQVLGGAGYTRDFLVEKYWRDNRLNMIHEGTHGIQAIDLLGRRVRHNAGAGMQILGQRIQQTLADAFESGFAPQAALLEESWHRLVEVTDDAWSTGDPSRSLPNATPYLQAFGHIVMGWIWLDVALTAATSQRPAAAGSSAAMQFFFRYELPRVRLWLDVVETREAVFEGLDPVLL